jgi:hypothetical protein
MIRFYVCKALFKCVYLKFSIKAPQARHLVSSWGIEKRLGQNPVNNNGPHLLNREFTQGKELSVVVSDLTYVRVDKKRQYICVLVDLFNREIIGYSADQIKMPYWFTMHLQCFKDYRPYLRGERRWKPLIIWRLDAI